MKTEKVFRICVGPGRNPKEIKCVHGNWKSDKTKVTDFHELEDSVDLAPYNGIINWKCSKCFDEHRKLINKK